MLNEQKMKNLINKKSNETNLPLQQLYGLFAIEQFLIRINNSHFKEKFILKGGYLLTTKGVTVMIKVSVYKCGDSMGIRLPKAVINSLDINESDSLNIIIQDDAVVLSKYNREITIEELFKDYKGGSFQSEIHEFESMGNENWSK